MNIAAIVTRGYGFGIAAVVTRGYIEIGGGEVAAADGGYFGPIVVPAWGGIYE